MAARLLIVDDHAIVREGLKRVLGAGGDGWQIREASGGRQALEYLREESVALAIIDLSMPDMSGLELLRRLHAEHPHLPVLVLSMHAEEQYAIRAYRAGAKGYLTKDSAAPVLVAAVRQLVAGGAFVPSGLAEQVVLQLVGAAKAPSHALLSDRELQVLTGIVEGRRLTEIADALHLSVKTVSTHKSRILEKLHLPNTAALIRYGMENDLSLGPSVGQRERPAQAMAGGAEPDRPTTHGHDRPAHPGDAPLVLPGLDPGPALGSVPGLDRGPVQSQEHPREPARP